MKALGTGIRLATARTSAKEGFVRTVRKRDHPIYNGLWGRCATSSVQEDLHPLYCNLHQSSQSRTLGETRTTQCGLCADTIETNYVRCVCCLTCSRHGSRCVMCGEILHGLDVEVTTDIDCPLEDGPLFVPVIDRPRQCGGSMESKEPSAWAKRKTFEGGSRPRLKSHLEFRTVEPWESSGVYDANCSPMSRQPMMTECGGDVSIDCDVDDSLSSLVAQIPIHEYIRR